MPEVLGMDFDSFAKFMAPHWTPGKHVALCGPTEAAKTTAACLLLRANRRFVGAFDAKGGDSTLKAAGFTRVPEWNRRVHERILQESQPSEKYPRGKPTYLAIGPEIERRADRPRLVATMEAALESMSDDGGWTVYFDELQLMYDRRMGRMSDQIDEMLISARDPKRMTVVTSYQAPANVSRRASDQAWWFLVFRTRDTDVVNRLGEMAGRSRAEMRGMVSALPKFSLLAFSRDLDLPVIATRTRPIVPPPAERRPELAAPTALTGWRRWVWGEAA